MQSSVFILKYSPSDAEVDFSTLTRWGKEKGNRKGGGIVFNMHKIKLSNQRLVWLKKYDE